MADRLKPQNKELVERIRKLESEVAKPHVDFHLYHNYYAPPELVKASKRVLSFGVGGDVSFEKLMCLDNSELQIKIFDPTPWTQHHIRGILNGSGKKYFKPMMNGLDISRKIGKRNITYFPIGYAPENGKQKFYYTGDRNPQTGEVLEPYQQIRSFSAFDPTGKKLSVICEFKNLETIMQEQKWDSVDIIKTDIEGHWYNFANELIEKNIQFKYWVTEIELGLNDSIETNFDQIREICSKLKDNYDVVLNRQRLKPMLELGFVKK